MNNPSRKKNDNPTSKSVKELPSSTTIGVVARRDHPEALAVASRLRQWCSERGLALLAGSDQLRTAEISGVPSCSLSQLPQRCSVVCSLGGDGTLISCARFSGDHAPLFLGVHFGTLGFLTELAPDELFPVLEQVVNGAVLDGRVQVSTRSLFSVSVVRQGQPYLETQSLNDVVIQKGARSRLIEIDVHCGEQPVMRLRSDGLIVATPTGSTAYSLAAGGPIIEPSLAAMTLTPICPHSLTSRPLVLGTEQPLTITVPETPGKVFAIIDGVETAELVSGDTVTICEAAHRVRFFKPKKRSYFESLQRKLHWNAPNDGSL